MFSDPQGPSPPIPRLLEANRRIHRHWRVRIVNALQSQGVQPQHRSRRECTLRNARKAAPLRSRAGDPPHIPRRPSIAPEDHFSSVCRGRGSCVACASRRLGFFGREREPFGQGHGKCANLACPLLRLHTCHGRHLLPILHELEPVSDSASGGCGWTCRFRQRKSGLDRGAGASSGWTEMKLKRAA
jgi:hypothetical protein